MAAVSLAAVEGKLENARAEAIQTERTWRDQAQVTAAALAKSERKLAAMEAARTAATQVTHSSVGNVSGQAQMPARRIVLTNDSVLPRPTDPSGAAGRPAAGADRPAAGQDA